MLALLMGLSPASVAQEVNISDRSGRQVDYYFLFGIGQSELDLSFRDNRTQFDRMMALLGTMATDRIVIRASASPDGTVAFNEQLWSHRADVVRERIVDTYPDLSDKIRIQSKIEDWAGLYEAVLADPNVPNQEQAADIIAMSSSIESRKYFLRQLDDGKTWGYIAKNIFPTLRVVSVAVYYSVLKESSDTVFASRVIRDTIVVRDTVFSGQPMVFSPVSNPMVESKEPGPGMSLKTNLVYWLALQPNVEAEFYFARRWSLNLEAQVAWWSLPDQHIHYRYAHFSPEARFWFRGNGSFTGHYVGLAVGGGLYDLSLGQQHNNYEGYQGEFATVSITYGHMWHIKNNFYIEVGLGVGYLFTEYRRYQYLDTHNVYQSTERLQMFIPTKLKVNLVWRLGNGTRKR